MKIALLMLLPLFEPVHEQGAMVYPRACCSGEDCRPYACDLLEALPGGGMRDTIDGTIWSRHQVYPSLDDRCHICIGKVFPIPRCVFTVSGS